MPEHPVRPGTPTGAAFTTPDAGLTVGDLIEDRRYAWKLMLPIDRSSVLLSIGFDPVAVGEALSPHVAQVETMIACQQHEALPFGDAVFDAVVMKGLPVSRLYEGVRGLVSRLSRGERRTGYMAQRDLLVEVDRVLKPNGCIFLSLDNRFSLERMISIIRSGPSHSSKVTHDRADRSNRAPEEAAAVCGPLHSLRGYTRLLQASGFGFTNVFSMVQDRRVRSLRQVFPLKMKDGQWLPVQASSLRERLSTHPYLASVFWVIAVRRDHTRQSILNSLIERICSSREKPAQGSICIEKFEIRPKNKIHVDVSAGSTSFIVKIPLDAASLRGARRNWRMLTLMRRCERLETPVPVANGEQDGLPFYAEERLNQATVDRGELECVGDSLLHMERLINRINPKLESATFANLIGHRFDVLVQRPLDTILALVREEPLALQARKFIRDRLYGLPCRLGVVHGDLSLSNIHYRAGWPTGLFDWEQSVVLGIPALDAMDYLIARQREREWTAFAVPYFLLYDDKWPEASEMHFLRRQMERSGVPGNQVADLAILYWLRYVAPQVKDATIFRHNGVNKRIVGILARMLSG